MFRLPPAVRIQLWTAYLQTARYASPHTLPRTSVSLFGGLRSRYATVHVGQDWTTNGNAPAKAKQDENLPTIDKIVAAAKAALDSHSLANEAEKSAVLEQLQRRVDNPPTNPTKKRAFRRRVTAALAHSNPMLAIRQAVQGNSYAPSPYRSTSFGGDSGGHPGPTDEDRKTSEAEGWADMLAHESQENSTSFVLRDTEYVRSRMAMPTQEAYTGVEAKLFKAIALFQNSDPFLSMWQRYSKKNISLGTFMHFTYKNRSEFPASIAIKLPPGSHGCSVSVGLPGGIQVSAVGAGVSKGSAKRAAILHAMSKLHSSGRLRHLFDLLATRGQAFVTSDTQTPQIDASHEDRSPETVSFLTRGEYPEAPQGLFVAGGWRIVVGNACRQRGIPFEIEGADQEGSDAFELSVKIGDFFTGHVIGSGGMKKADASSKMLRKLHTSGALHQLFPTTAPASDEDKHSTEVPVDQRQTEEHMDMPTKQQYPDAPGDLFDALRAPVAINSACQQLGYSLKVEGSATTLRRSGFVYELKVNIAELCAVTANGQGQTKQLAKRDAWSNSIGKLHAEGALKQLFPGLAGPAQNPSDESHSQLHYEESELVDVDDKILEDEKDAKVEIYNYAASLGFLPIFKIENVKSRGRRRLQGRPVRQQIGVKVTISLPELDLSVSGVGRTLISAEVAAALEFKRLAEEKHVSKADHVGSAKTDNSHLLTVETAPQFFEMYRSLRHQSKVELEQETINAGGHGLNSAKVLIDDNETGPPAMMRNKKEAEAVAYLGAALKIVASEPDLLSTFAEALQKCKGKVLRDVRPINATIDSLTLRTMRDTLVEARRAGLPDEREALAAEEIPPKESRNYHKALAQKDREAASKRLSGAWTQFREDPRLAQLCDSRADLPMTKYRSQVLELVSTNIFSIIIGATGSGKTTQVPQILLDDAIRHGNGGFCDVICTQPRRLAASSIARRVAVERNEPLGKSVGYHVRLDARRPQPGGSITYCTTGVLLEQLKHDADAILDNVSHLVIDEVHERDISIDFLLNILRKAIRERQGSCKRVPKVILMSATLDEKLFSTYFSQDADGQIVPCPALSVPGRTFPVQERYLGDILSDLKTLYGNDFNHLINLDSSTSKDYIASEMAFAGTSLNQRSGSIIDWKRERIQESDHETQLVKEKEDAFVPLALLVGTIAHICKTTPNGSILAFLPGLQEITGSRDMLLQQPLAGVDFSDASKFKICILHSAVPAEEQRVVLDPVPEGCRKIILSTNIAETSVTVPDVKYVVDTGKLRESRYDQIRRITKLQCTWESNSNARQRAGRAGRVQEGHYYALYTRERRRSLAASGLPELLRSDLQEICLAVKAQGFKEPVTEFLAESIQAPPAQAVRIAINNLQAVEAFTTNEDLTSLGRILSKLPVHPTLGKMVILGIVFRCLDPMLILSCMSNQRSLFGNPVGGRTLAKQAHAKYCEANSDHIALLNAFKVLRRLRREVGISATNSYARTNFLHTGAFQSIMSTAEHIEQILIESGLVPEAVEAAPTSSVIGGEALNRHSDNTALVKCLLLAGVHPNLGVKNPGRSRAHRTPAEHSVLIHPTSQYSKRHGQEGDFLYAYNSLAKSVDGHALFMRDITQVTPLMAMLFGGKLQTENWGRLEMDEWLPFNISGASDTKYATQLILEFRKALDRMLHGAFQSISGFQRDRPWTENLVSEQFVHGIAQMFNEKKLQDDSWVPSNWGKAKKVTPASTGL